MNKRKKNYRKNLFNLHFYLSPKLSKSTWNLQVDSQQMSISIMETESNHIDNGFALLNFSLNPSRRHFETFLK